MEEQGQDQNKNQNKLGFFAKYKEGVLAKEKKKHEKKIDVYKEQSGSKIFTDRVLAVMLDVVSWGIIAVFVWIWWENRGQSYVVSYEDCHNFITQVDLMRANATIGEGMTWESLNNITMSLKDGMIR